MIVFQAVSIANPAPDKGISGAAPGINFLLDVIQRSNKIQFLLIVAADKAFRYAVVLPAPLSFRRSDHRNTRMNQITQTRIQFSDTTHQY